MKQSHICESAKRFYERVFLDEFFAAAGEEMITTNLDVAIDYEIEEIVKNAGRRAGLELLNRRLGGSYAT